MAELIYRLKAQIKTKSHMKFENGNLVISAISSPIQNISTDTASNSSITKTVYGQDESLHLDGFQIKILNVYKMPSIGDASNLQYPQNKYVLVVEVQIKNESNNSRYFGDSVLIANGDQYEDSTVVDVYGQYFLHYDSKSSVQIEPGASIKTFVGFDTEDINPNDTTVTFKPWMQNTDEKATVKLTTIQTVE